MNLSNRLGFVICAVVAALFFVLGTAQGAFALEPKLNLLVISTFGKDPPAQRAFERGLDEELGFRSGRNNIYFEFLDIPRLPTENAASGVAALIGKKYLGIKFDAVVAWAFPAARLVSENRQFFADAPVIFLELTDPQIASLAHRKERDFDLSIQANYEGSLKDALRLRPAKRIVLIGETRNQAGALRFEAAREAIANVAPELAVDELTDLTLDEVVSRASNLPPESLIYYLLMFSDGQGTNMQPFDVARRITEKANAPLFTQWESLMGSGVVGGYQLSIEEVGKNIGRAAMALARGKPVSATSHMRYVYDWNQLHKWGWDDAGKFPAGAVFMNRPPDLLQEYRWHIATAGLFIVALLALSISLARALHARNRAVASLAGERESLAEKVRERTVELDRKAEELARSNRELESFAYAVSHDLRAPVRVINGFAQLLERRFKDALKGDGAEFLEHIVTSARGMDAMILGLLDFSRAGHQSPESFEPADLKGLAKDVADMLNGEADAQGGRIEMLLPADLPQIRCNRELIRRLLQNLVENALKYRSPERSPLIRIEMASANGRIEVAVHDNGMGIPEEKREKVFGLFQREAPASVPGYGIGLALCQRIVQVHQGRIWVESEPAGGCCIRFTLPIM